MPTLNTPNEFEQAVETAHDLADRLANSDQSSDAEKLDRLLLRIAEFHDRQPVSAQASNLEKLGALEERLKAFGRRWPTLDGEDHSEHWSPMLGGDPVQGHHDR